MEYSLLFISPRVRAQQDSDRACWTGLDIEKIGKIGEGSNKSLSEHLQKNNEKFKMLLSETPSLQNFLKFSPISESQLLKTGPPSNTYSKGTFGLSRNLLYKVYKAEATLVRSILEASGFGYTDSHDWNIMWLGCSAKLYLYEGLHAHQRINHFPNSFEITRKDKMCSNLMAMQEKHGAEEYGFFPETYIMPKEFNSFCLRYRSDKETKWIVKPSNSSQGRGIHILENLQSLRTGENCVVSRFIHNPLLIQDLKFDLRIYVLVTSFEPLKIYIYDEGLARFASENYSSFSAANKFSFLTNYSINKQNENYVQNEDLDHDSIGHKWSLSALLKYLEKSKVDTSLIMSKLYDMIVKTIITVESTVVPLVRKYNLSRSNCFDLFGFDVLLDADLKLWLLEVNLSPSLATDSPLDLHIKGKLVSELFNIVGVKNYDRRADHIRHLKTKTKNLRPNTANPSEIQEKYKEIYKETLEEFSRLEHFLRIYPCEGCEIYDKFFNVPRKINRAISNYLFKEKVNKNVLQVVITGEDLLIEYLSRVLNACDQVVLNERWEGSIREFVNHEIWGKIKLRTFSTSVLKRLMEISIELKKRNLKTGDKENSEQKEKIINKFTSGELENILRNTKNELNSIVSCLINGNFALLSELDSYASKTPKRAYVDLKCIISKHKTTQ